MNETILLPELSEKYDIILTQLMKAKGDMGTAVKKDASNPFHKSKYASLGSHLELCEPVLSKHGLLMLPTVNILNNQHVLVTTLHHPQSGQWLKTYLPLHNPKNDSQGVGASLTYMRRYAINSLFSLNAEDDDGETASGRGKYEKQAAKESSKHSQRQEEEKSDVIEKIDRGQIVVLNSLINKMDEDSSRSFLNWISKNFNAVSLQDIPKSGFEKCMTSINAKIKYMNDKNKQNAMAVA